MAQAKPLPSVCVEKNITETPAYQNIKRRQDALLKPSQNHVTDFSNIEISPDGLYVAGVATICDDLKSSPKNRLATICLSDGKLEMYGSRTGSDSFPKWSPDGGSVAFISAVEEFSQLHLLDRGTKEIKAITNIPGLIENLSWSPTGARILLNVAGINADKGMDQAATIVAPNQASGEESWMPEIEAPTTSDEYRTAWVYDVTTDRSEQVSPPGLNLWEAVWSSESAIVGICSDLPGEEDWYASDLRQFHLGSSPAEVFYNPSSPNSLEGLRASPAGSRTAFVVGIASDRGLLWGDLHVRNASTNTTARIDTLEVDVGCLDWCSEHDLVAAGARGLEEVVIHHDFLTGQTRELWRSNEESIGPFFKGEISAHKGDTVECVFVRSGIFNPPALIHITKHGVRTVRTFGSSEMEDKMRELATQETIEWKAPDGQVIHGRFFAPKQPGPHPTILSVHGGPIWHWRARYMGEIGEDVPDWVFLESGFAIFKPNPRGSTGRGQSFVRQVYQDMGGADTHDCLSGVDALVESGRADPNRLAVYGVSYGGYMTCWLVTQTNRFSAAVPVLPVSDWVSEHYTSNLGKWVATFLGDGPRDREGKYFTRSPLHQVDKATTPTLLVCGGRDGACPPTQALEFHKALEEKGVVSVMVKYPEESHGVKHLPAFIDFSARVSEWLKHFV